MDFDIRPPQQNTNLDDATQVKQDEQNQEPRQKSWLFRFFLILVLAGLAGAGFLVFKTSATFNVVSERVDSFLGIKPSHLPLSDPKEKNRLDILILGLRGAGDPNGGLLTDTMLTVSIDTANDKIAFISIPRDLYIDIPIVNKQTKINEAYELGESQRPNGGGLFLAKQAAQKVLGINIDYVVAIDFKAFKDTVDLLGGIDVHVAKTLNETKQWGGIDFYVPAGTRHMDGDTALLYARSRFTTSDFDRARRQQEIILAVKEKALSLGFLGNPLRLANFFDILGRDVRTDINASDLPNVLTAYTKVASQNPARLVLDTSGHLLYSTTINGSYVLLPYGGNFDSIHNVARNIWENAAN